MGWFATLAWLAVADSLGPADYSILAVGNTGILLGYLLSRTSRFRQAALLAIAVVHACCWSMALLQTDPIDMVFGLQFTVVGVALAGATLPRTETLWVGLINLIACTAILVFEPELGLPEAQGALGLLVFITGLSVTSALLTERDHHTLQRRSLELRASQEQLRHSALHDELTGLPNRSLLADRLGQALTLARRRPEHYFAVLFLDLDHFKVVNDSLGHHVGDRLLVEVARRLRTCVRPGDTIARLGGDEFIILLTDLADSKDVERVTARVQEVFEAPFNVAGHEVQTTASVGVAAGELSYTRPEELLRDADTAMYRAKALGRSRTEQFEASMRVKALARLGTEIGIRQGLDEDQFVVHYQPIVSLGTRKILSFEALVRWQHPEAGLVGPDQFIQVAEETGLIEQLGAHVLEVACRDACQWPSSIGLHVNVSPRQFRRRGGPQQLAKIVSDSGIEPNRVTLELTEGILMADPEHSRVMLDAFRESGIRIDVDDFGTGYSSLAYLHQFALDGLKVDQSFVAALDTRDDVVRSVVALCQGMDLRLTAEGVETEAQLIKLLSLDCERGQGWLFGRPKDAAATLAMVRRKASGRYLAQVTEPGRELSTDPDIGGL
ncbi:MAG: EAL domain-containing protein [Proteobacteria bacterium]|nr:EAL domain-containing protein [Pseudomonadota bacterium]